MRYIRALTQLLILTCLSICFSGCEGNLDPIRISGDTTIEPVVDSEDTDNLQTTIGVVLAQTGKHAEPYGLPMTLISHSN